MKRLAAAAMVFALAASPAFAALKIGDTAPVFTTQASLGGKEFTFALADALKKGPVVVYFYPEAFTHGCSLEAHAFAEAMPQFTALGASVIGLSHDGMEKLVKFSTADCASAFPVGTDADHKIMTTYDARSAKNPEYASRTSYLVAPDGKILAEYTNPDFTAHVDTMLAALKAWKASH
ncbi:MAG: peroxiredoxin [Alphaproteobacteria bacterium]|nr:peroxiredoxin [Alphaproteobacteria bacterium]MBV9905154.1 peroxiredoxin [Alphaproteobacteria bacterium]